MSRPVSSKTPKNFKTREEQTTQIKEAALALITEANQSFYGSRLVTKNAAFTIVDRSLEKNSGETFSLRKHRALVELNQFISLAQTNKVFGSKAENTDLLPLAHPASSRFHYLTSAELSVQRARWITDDPSIKSDEVKTLLSSALTSHTASAEYEYAITRLSTMEQGLVPQYALVAAFGDGNSSAARSARAMLQRRDRYGRFAEMGGGIRGLIRRANGIIQSLTGRAVSQGIEGDTFDMELPDGKIVRVPATSVEGIKAIIPGQQTKDGYSKSAAKADSSDPIINENDLVVVDSPDGFRTDDAWQPSDADKEYYGNADLGKKYTDDAYDVIKFDSPNAPAKDKFEAAQQKESEGQNVATAGQGANGELDPEKPVYFITRRGSEDSQPFGAVQSWADVQNLITQDEPKLDAGTSSEPTKPIAIIPDAPTGGDAETPEIKGDLIPAAKKLSKKELREYKKDLADYEENGGLFPLDPRRNNLILEDGSVLDNDTGEVLRDASGKPGPGYVLQDFKPDLPGASGPEAKKPPIDVGPKIKLPELLRGNKGKGGGGGDDGGDDGEFEYPEGYYKIKKGAEHTPEGAVDGQVSKDFTDDPVELAQRYETSDITKALKDSVEGDKDSPAPAYGLLEFEAGDELVPAEALYNALKEQGEDADKILGDIYKDGMFSKSKGKKFITVDKPTPSEDPIAIIDPSPFEDDEFDPAEEIADEEIAEYPPLIEGLTEDEKRDFIDNGQYQQYLPENITTDAPSGYNTLDKAPYVDDSSSYPEDAPEGYAMDPVSIASSYKTEDLKDQLRVAIEPGGDMPGYGELSEVDENGEEYVSYVPGEALRDALQLQNVDTNEFIDSIYSEGVSGQDSDPTPEEIAKILEQEEGMPDPGPDSLEPVDEPDSDKGMPEPVPDEVDPDKGMPDPGPDSLEPVDEPDSDKGMPEPVPDEVDPDKGMPDPGPDSLEPVDEGMPSPELDEVEPVDEGMPEPVPSPTGPRKASVKASDLQAGDVVADDFFTVENVFSDAESEAIKPGSVWVEGYYPGHATQKTKLWNKDVPIDVYRGVDVPEKGDLPELSKPKPKEYDPEKKTYKNADGVFVPKSKEAQSKFLEDVETYKNAIAESKAKWNEPQEFQDDTTLAATPENPVATTEVPSTKLQPGDITYKKEWGKDYYEFFVVESVTTDGADEGTVKVTGYYPGHKSQEKTWQTSTNIQVIRNAEAPAAGSLEGLERPKKDDDDYKEKKKSFDDAKKASAASYTPPVDLETLSKVSPSVQKPVAPAFSGAKLKEIADASGGDPKKFKELLDLEEVHYLDFESTGGVKNPNPLQVSIQKVKNGEVVDTLTLFMNPEAPLDSFYTSKNPDDILKDSDGKPISDEFLSKQMSQEEAFKKISEFLGESPIVAAHSMPFDGGILKKYFAKHGLEYSPSGEIDTLALSRHVINGGNGDHTLQAVSNRYGLASPDTDWHDASIDTAFLYPITEKLLDEMGTSKSGIGQLDLDKAKADFDAADALYKESKTKKTKADSEIAMAKVFADGMAGEKNLPTTEEISSTLSTDKPSSEELSPATSVNKDEVSDGEFVVESVLGGAVSNNWVTDDENTANIGKVPVEEWKTGDFFQAKNGGWYEVLSTEQDPDNEKKFNINARLLANGKEYNYNWIKYQGYEIRRRNESIDAPVEAPPVEEPILETDEPVVKESSAGKWEKYKISQGTDGVYYAENISAEDVQALRNGELTPPNLPFFAPLGGGTDTETGEGYYFSSDGKRFWGKYGASGALVRRKNADGQYEYFLAKRSSGLSQGGNKWGYPGGAHKDFTTAKTVNATAKEEFKEEVGGDLTALDPILVHSNSVSPDWVYDTYVFEVGPNELNDLKATDGENSETGWFTADQIKQMAAEDKLHPDFADSSSAILDLSQDETTGPQKETPVEEVSSPADVSKSFDISNWKKVGPQSGSNQGAFYVDPDTGDQYYVKVPKSDKHASNEVLASALYAEAGVNVGRIYLGKDKDGNTVLVSPLVPDSVKDFSESKNDPEVLKSAQEGFAVDAWLNNWDSVGLAYDNMLRVGKDVYRVDPGGSLLFRAQGKDKSSTLTDDVTQIDSLQDPSFNTESSDIFGSMTPEQIAESAKKVQAVTPEKIEELVDAAFPNDPESASFLKQRLISRRQNIIDKYNLGSAEPVETPEAETPSTPAPSSEGLPEGYEIKEVPNTGSSLDMVEIVKDGEQVGYAAWNKETKIIENIQVFEGHRGKGLSKSLWAEAKKLEPELKHSAYRTPDGDRFAHATGGYVPPLQTMGNWTNEQYSAALDRGTNQVKNLLNEEESLTEKFEAEGMTTSDAQGVASAEMKKKYGKTALEALNELPADQAKDVLEERENEKNEISEAVKPSMEAEPVGALDVNSPNLQEEIQFAIDKGQKVAFSYNGKNRIVLPKSLWTNPKNGNVNLRAIEDGVEGPQKNFTLDKMEMAEGSLPSPNAPKPTPTPTPTPSEPVGEETEKPTKLPEVDKTKLKEDITNIAEKLFGNKGNAKQILEALKTQEGADVDLIDSVIADLEAPKPAKTTPSTDSKIADDLEQALSPEEGDEDVTGIEPIDATALAEELSGPLNPDLIWQKVQDQYGATVLENQHIVISSTKPDANTRIDTLVKRNSDNTFTIYHRITNLTDGSTKVKVRRGRWHSYTALNNRIQNEIWKAKIVPNKVKAGSKKETASTLLPEPAPTQPGSFVSADGKSVIKVGMKVTDSKGRVARVVALKTQHNSKGAKYGYTDYVKIAYDDVYGKDGKKYKPRTPSTKLTIIDDSGAIDTPPSSGGGGGATPPSTPTPSTPSAPSAPTPEEVSEIIAKEESSLEAPSTSGVSYPYDVVPAIGPVTTPGETKETYFQNLIEQAIEAENDVKVAFVYNGKDRVLLPKKIFVNPKNGNVNVTGILEGSTGLRTFTVGKMDFAAKPTGAEGLPPAPPIGSAPTGPKVPSLKGATSIADVESKALDKNSVEFLNYFGAENYSDYKSFLKGSLIKDANDKNMVPGMLVSNSQSTKDPELTSYGVVDLIDPTTGNVGVTWFDGPLAGQRKVVKDNTLFSREKFITNEQANDLGVQLDQTQYNKAQAASKAKGDKYANELADKKKNEEQKKAVEALKSQYEVNGAGFALQTAETPADWSSSPVENVPSLETALREISSKDKASNAKGASVLLDSDAVEDLEVRVQKVTDEKGEEKVRVQFVLTDWAANARVAEMLKSSEITMSGDGIRFDKYEIMPDGSIKKVGTWGNDKVDTNQEGTTHSGKAGRGTFKLHRATKDAQGPNFFIHPHNSSRAVSLHNKVDILLPADASAQDIADALQELGGISQVRPATPADVKGVIENKMIWLYGKNTDGKKNYAGKLREEVLKQIQDEYGFTADDVEIQVDAQARGRINFLVPESVAQQVMQKTGVKNFKHNWKSGFGTTDQARANNIFKILMSGALYSTTQRWSDGINTDGMSSVSDVKGNGGNYIFTSASKQSGNGSSSELSFTFDGSKVLRRLDFYKNNSDQWGQLGSSEEDNIQKLSTEYGEIMFKKQISWADLAGVSMPTGTRKLLLEKLTKEGITEIGGVDIIKILGGK